MKNVAVVVVVAAAFAAVLSAQSVAPSDGTTAALVTELRALRADLNRIAGASIRMQLLVGRLQLQEQRILSLSRQVADAQKDMAAVAQARAALEGQVKHMEAARNIPPEEREQMQGAFDQLRQQLSEQQKREQQLREQESYLSALIADEQARWADFNARLDELERTLGQADRRN